RLVEVLNVLAQQLEILTALLEAVHLPRGFLREIVHLLEPLVQRFERQLLPGEVVGLCEQRLEPFRDRVDLLRQRVDVLIFRPERWSLRLSRPASGRRSAFRAARPSTRPSRSRGSPARPRAPRHAAGFREPWP